MLIKKYLKHIIYFFVAIVLFITGTFMSQNSNKGVSSTAEAGTPQFANGMSACNQWHTNPTAGGQHCHFWSDSDDGDDG